MPTGSILVADDDAAIRTVLNQALSRAGYEVRSTGNAATLWRWITQGDGDLVITDVVMPDENAFDLIPRIRKARPDLPIVVMSAQNTFMTAIRASERGAYEYLPKPFDLKELISIVGRALAEPKEPRTAPPKNEDLEGIPLVGRSPAMIRPVSPMGPVICAFGANAPSARPTNRTAPTPSEKPPMLMWPTR